MMAFVKIIETSVDSNNTGGDVFTSPNGSWAGKSLPLNTDWNYFGTQTVNGKTWYDLGGDQWISEEYAAPNITKFEQRRGIAKVSNFTTATVYYSPNGNPNRVANPSPLPMNYEYAYNKAVTDSQGIIWLDVGRSQWVTTREVVDQDNVTSSERVKVTFYDPAVLGSNLGYGGVAANLAKYPKGTKLKIVLDVEITDADGQKKKVLYRTVNDTGTFVNDNPAQIDLAVPTIPEVGVTYAMIYKIG